MTSAAQPATASASNWAGWTAAERESFFAAIARHRRAAWRVTFVTRAINAVVALIVAIMMAPLFYCALALLLDCINLLVPVPNLVTRIVHGLDTVLNSPEKVSARERLEILFWMAAPGLAWMALVLNALRRVLGICMSFDSGELTARPPDPTLLSEQRFANVVSEMAIAANLPAPRVLVVGGPAIDALAFGLDEHHSTIVVAQELLNLLNRAQMEGLAANLVASIADGDTRIGMRAALSLSLFALIARLGNAVTEPGARRNVTQLVTAILLPTKSRARNLLTDLADPLRDESRRKTPREARRGGASSIVDDTRIPGPDAVTSPASAVSARREKIRNYLWMPLAGPLVMTGFFGALFNLFILGPLLSLAWRQRKYMADATAVRLTRDPDTLASALQQMTHAQGAPLAPWTAHLSVAGHGKNSNLFGSSFVPLFPSIERRLRALGTLGAHIPRKPPHKLPLWVWLIAAPLLTLLVILITALFPLLVWVSFMLTMLFTGIPFALLHSLLRLLGHQ